MGRGQLTTKVIKVAKEQLGYKIDVTELRLMPYLQYCMMNSEAIVRAKINSDDFEVLKKWETKGFLDFNITEGRFKITEKFYRAIMEILLVAYCYASIMPQKRTKNENKRTEKQITKKEKEKETNS